MNLQKTAAKVLFVSGIVSIVASMFLVCFCSSADVNHSYYQVINLDDAAFHNKTKLTRAEFTAEHDRELAEMESHEANVQFVIILGLGCLISGTVIYLGSRLPNGPKP